MAYKLKLPESSSVHPIFHVSLLKKVKGPIPSTSPVLPPGDESMQTPELVLDRRLKNKNNRVVSQLLVWMGWPVELATGKMKTYSWCAIQKHRLGDKSIFKEGRMSRTSRRRRQGGKNQFKLRTRWRLNVGPGSPTRESLGRSGLGRLGPCNGRVVAVTHGL